MADQVGVDHAARRRPSGREQVEQPVADHHVLPQRHRPVLVDDDRGVAAHGDQPVAELLGVAHRGRQADQRDVLGELQDHLLPHRAAEPVGEVVHLVHHHEAEVVQLPAARVDHVAQHLGGHHHHLRVAVDGGVAGEQPDGGLPVPLDEVGVLLVGQRLDRRRVEALAALGQREVHRELADHGLARAGRRAHEHAVPVLQRRARPELEVVELERQSAGELGQLGVRGAAPGGGVGLGRRDCLRTTGHPSRLTYAASGDVVEAVRRVGGGIGLGVVSSGLGCVSRALGRCRSGSAGRDPTRPSPPRRAAGPCGGRAPWRSGSPARTGR